MQLKLRNFLNSRNKNAENPIPMARCSHRSAQDMCSHWTGIKVAVQNKWKTLKKPGVVKRESLQVIYAGYSGFDQAR